MSYGNLEKNIAEAIADILVARGIGLGGSSSGGSVSGTVTANLGTIANVATEPTLSAIAAKDFATQSTLAAILAELRDDTFVSSTLWEDKSGTTPIFYREERIKSQDDGTVSTIYTRLSDNTVVGSLPAGTAPVMADADRQIEAYRWRVKAGQSGTGYSSGDFLTNTIVFNTSGSGSILSNAWYNLTTSAAIAAPDPTKIEDLAETILQAIRDRLPSGGIFPASQSGTWTVATGGLTDAQLRATPPSVIPTDGTTAISLSTSDADGTSTVSNRLRVTGHLKGYNGTTWDMIRAGVTGVVSSVTGFLNGLVFAQYKTTPPLLTDGQYTVLQSRSDGSLKVSESYLTVALDSSSSSYTSVNGSEKYFTVPTGKEWQTITVYATFTCSGTTGTRQIAVRFEDSSGGYLGRIPAGAIQSSSTRYYTFAVGLPDLTSFRDTDKLLTPIPPQILKAGSVIRILDSAVISTSGDSLVPKITVAERSV